MLNNSEQHCYCFGAVSQHGKGSTELKSSMLDHNLDTEFQSNQAVMETVHSYFCSQKWSMHGWKKGLRGISKCSICEQQ